MASHPGNTRSTWSSYCSSAVDFQRRYDKFPPFADMLPDPRGRLDGWLKATRIIPLRAIEHRCLKGWTVFPRMIGDCMWFWIENGHGRFWMGQENRSYTFHPGDLILIPQGVPHAIYPQRGYPLRQIAVHFHAKVFGAVNLLDLLGFPCLVPACPEAPFEAESAVLVREFALQSPGWERAMSNAISNVLLFIVRHYGRLFKPLPICQSDNILPRLVQLLTGIDRQLGDPYLNVPQLARRAGCSPVALRKMFKSITGLGPAAFLQRRRIEQACEYLRGSQMCIKEIAERTGFRDLAFFYRIFHQWTNSTPARYREGCSRRRTMRLEINGKAARIRRKGSRSG